MSGITLASYSSVGYSLTSAGTSSITLTPAGTIAVTAANAAAIYSQVGVSGSVANSGSISSALGTGVSLTSGGVIVNGSANQHSAQISAADYGIRIDQRAAGTVINYGTISAPTATASYAGIAIALGGNGLIVNGSEADTLASIVGNVTGVRATGTDVSVQNFGTIAASGSVSYAVYLRDGGSITNGSVTDISAVINGYYLGVQTTTKGVSIVNYGTIESFSTVTSFGRAVHLSAGGTAVNGSTADTSALMLGEETGLYIKGPSNNGATGFSPSQVFNYGTIEGILNTGLYIRLGQNSLVVNGSGSDTAALIEGAASGLRIQSFAAATVSNYGTIMGGIGGGVILTSSGVVTNGSAVDTTALISGTGTNGISLGGSGASTVTNYGTIAIVGTANSRNVALYGSGTIANGSAVDHAASILGGGTGISDLLGYALIANYGTISSGVGVSFYKAAGRITMTGSGTIINDGVIASTSGASGTAIKFGTGNERLIVDPGASFVGKVLGGSGTNTLELAGGGRGTLYGVGSNFTNFGTVVVDAGGYWLLQGSNTLAAGVTLINGGTLVDAGSLLIQGSFGYSFAVANGATLINAGTIGAGGSTVTFGSGGLLTIDPGAVFTGAVIGAGDTRLELASGAAGTLSGLGSVYLGFASVAVDNNAYWTFAGSNTLLDGLSLTNSGTLAITGTLQNNGSIGGTVTVASGGTLINGGTLGGGGATNGTATTIATGGRLVIDPGATFVGRVLGNTAGSTLELAGGGQGTLTALGSSFSGFTGVKVDQNASWTLGGYSTVAAGCTVNSAGTLTALGVLTNNGFIDARLTIVGATTLKNFGTLGGGGAVTTITGAGILQVESGAVFQGTVKGNSYATLELASGNGGIGVLSGLGSSFTNFGSILVDRGSQWTLAGSNTLSSGATMVISGGLIDAGALVNQGSISGVVTVATGATLEIGGILGGNGSTSGTAATLASGSRLILDPGETVVGKALATSGSTLELAGGAANGLLSGLGSSLSGFSSVVVDAGATWTMAGNNTVAAGSVLTVGGVLLDAGSLVDAGTMSGPVTVASGATLTVSGFLGADGATTRILGGGLLAVNPGAAIGSVLGSAGATLELTSGGTGVLSGLGVAISAFGAVTVDRSANWGFAGTNTVASGTSLSVSGTLTDTGTMTVAGTVSGTVTVAGGATLVDQGTIGFGGAANSTAASVAVGGRLLLASTAVIVGRLTGGGTGSILELASGAAGTLTGLGGSITNFGSVVLDTGAAWTLAGPSTVAAGTTLTDMGTLIATGVLLNNGSIGGPLTIAAGATLSNYGTIGSGGTAASFAAGGGLLQVAPSAVFSGTVRGGGLTTMEFLGGSTGTLSGLDGSNAGTVTSAGNTWAFSGMGSLIVDRPASWTLSGTNTLGTANGVSVAGTLAATGGLIVGGSGTLIVTGGTARLLAKGGLTLQGATLDPTGGGVAEVGGAGSSVSSAVVIDAGKTLSGFGAIAAPVTDSGVLLAQGGTLIVAGRVSGTGGVTLASGATLIAQNGLGEANLTFAVGGGETLQVTKGTTIGATISGLGSTDVIDFLGTVATGMTFTGGRLKLTGAGGTIANLAFAGTYSSGNFAFGSDGHGGTNLTTVGLGGLRSSLTVVAGASTHVPFTPSSTSHTLVGDVMAAGHYPSSTGNSTANALLGLLHAAHS